MPLSSRLRQVDLTLECKHCGHSITKTGLWFISIHRFQCEACKREVPIGYSDKVTLFNKHESLIATQAQIEPSLRQVRSPLAKAPRLIGYAGRERLHYR
jgi:hypothetical protein